jgi:Zn-dependent protease with chaperone function
MRSAFAVLLLLCSWSVVAAPRDEFDRRIESELRAKDPAAVDLWNQANAAREADRHKEAIALYAQVYARVPSFVHALRRQAFEESETGDRASALTHMRAAVAQARTGENLAGLATTLIDDRGTSVSDADAHEAKALAEEAVALEPKDPFELSTLAHVAIQTEDMDTLLQATEKLELYAPDDFPTHFFRMNVAAREGNWDSAFAALDRAHAAGLPDESYASMRKNLRSAQPFYLRWWKPALFTLLAWFAGFGILLSIGAIMSRMAVRAAKESPTDPTGIATGLSGGLRRAYAGVIALSAIFYYLSIPIVILLVLGLGAAIIYACFAAGTIPIKVVILVVVVGGISIWSMLKSLFVRRSDEDPGLEVDLEREPRLRALLDDVAARIGTRAVDHVYLTPGTEVAVMERKGRKERCLLLGVAALDGLALLPFKAVLGHEYGHFINRDTAGGAHAIAVRNSINATAIGIARGGAAAWYNPAWLFVTTFNRVFLRISEGASRLQEVLADRWAAFAYGAQSFEDGLRHIVERGVRFNAHVGVAIKEVVDQKIPLANLYTFSPAAPLADVSEAIDEALNRKSSPYDSHPTPAERFALVHALPKRDIESHPEDAMPAWSLFSDPLAMQTAMTEQVRVNVRTNYGVEIVAPAPSVS